MTQSSQQMGLFDTDTRTPVLEVDLLAGVEKARRYTLFIALLPEGEDARRITASAQQLRSAYHLTGPLLKADRLHMTLHALAHFTDEVSAQVIDAAQAAAMRITHPPIDVSLDCAVSFPKSNAFVLQCSPYTNAAIAKLRKLLAVEFRRNGLRPQPSGTPHMTLLYDQRHISAQSVEPLKWVATRLVLILSHVGLHHHQHVAELALADLPG